MSRELLKYVEEGIEALNKIKAVLMSEGEPKQVEAPEDLFDRKVLEKKSHAELKKIAKDLGVKSSGLKDAIIENIINFVDEVKETSKNIVDKVEEVVTGKEEPNLQEKIEALVADYTDAELKEILAEIEYPTTGKRQALIAKIVQAVEEGDLVLDDEDGDEEEDVSDEEPPTVAKRDTAISDLQKAVEAGEYDTEDMKGFLEEYHSEDEEFKMPKGKKLIEVFFEAAATMIDDDGETHEFSDPYEIGGVPFCCGKKLEDDYETKGNLYCEVCGNSYEVE